MLCLPEVLPGRGATVRYAVHGAAFSEFQCAARTGAFLIICAIMRYKSQGFQNDSGFRIKFSEGFSRLHIPQLISTFRQRKHPTMATFEVTGGCPLSGEIIPQGAKNEALQIICATLLTPERVTVHNIPEILDVMQLITLLEAMGVSVERLGQGSYAFQAKEVDLCYLQTDEFRKAASRLRGSVMITGPLLARYGVAYMPKPGGG